MREKIKSGEAIFALMGLLFFLLKTFAMKRDICLSSALRSKPFIEEETKINGVTHSLKWHVFDATGNKLIAVCYCYQQPLRTQQSHAFGQ